jgi:sugar phosphate permease
VAGRGDFNRFGRCREIEDSLFDQRLLRRTLRYRWYIVLVLAAQYLFVYFHRVSPAVVATDLMQSFQVSSGALGLLASAYFYPYAFMQIPVGMLADRWGTRKTVTLFGFLAGLGAIGFALSPSFVVAVLSRALVGFGLSAIFVPSMALLCNWFREREYVIVSGVFLAVGGFGWLTAATPLALLVQWLGWVATFILMGCVTLALTGLTWLVVADRPADVGLASVTRETRAGRAPGKLAPGMARVLKNRGFRPLALWNIMMGSAFFGFCGLWAGPYLTDVYALSKPAAGNVLAIIAVALIFGGPFLSYLSERVFHSRKKVLVGCTVVHLACWLPLLLFPASLPVFVLYAVFFPMGVTAGASVPVVMTATKELFPIEMAGLSMGMVNIFPFLGGVISQPLIGLLLDFFKGAGFRNSAAYQFVFLLFFVLDIGALWVIARARDRTV